MKVFVDSERCQGHTLCAMIAPDSFELSDIDGTSSPVRVMIPYASLINARYAGL